MAMIDEVVTKHFRPAPDDLGLIVSDLDLGIYTVGVGISMIRDMLLHGSPGSGSSKCDPEEVAASVEALLSYIGRLGPMIDRLEAGTNPLSPAARAAGDA